MIRVRFDTLGAERRLRLRGHATGDALVCAAASALAFALAGALREKPGVRIELERGEGGIVCPDTPEVDAAFAVAQAGFGLLEESYPQLVEVSYGGRAGKIETR